MSSRNRRAQELHEQTTTQWHACKIQRLKIVVEKYSYNDVSICSSLTRREAIYPATHRITDCTQLSQQRRKTPQQNPFAHHQRSVTVSDDITWQVKIGLHQSDNYLSQVKINVKQSTTAILKISGEFFVFHQDSAQAHRVRETISFLTVT